jgi:hypothetical protein
MRTTQPATVREHHRPDFLIFVFGPDEPVEIQLFNYCTVVFLRSNLHLSLTTNHHVSYSYLNAVLGWTRAARDAGTRMATSAAAIRTAGTVTNVTRSAPLMP